MRKIAVIIFFLLIAFSILFISILRTAAVRYRFTGDVHQGSFPMLQDGKTIDYFLANPGKVLPDNPIWPLKVIRDQVWYYSTTDDGRRADLYLLFADKRVAASLKLFENGEYNTGFSTLLKSQQYLEKALEKEKQNRETGIDTYEYLDRLAKASLMHYYVIEQIKSIAPEDAIPAIVRIEDYPKRAYFESAGRLRSIGRPAPENPFGWE